jgi:hypothetical protein
LDSYLGGVLPTSKNILWFCHTSARSLFPTIRIVTSYPDMFWGMAIGTNNPPFISWFIVMFDKFVCPHFEMTFRTNPFILFRFPA